MLPEKLGTVLGEIKQTPSCVKKTVACQSFEFLVVSLTNGGVEKLRNLQKGLRVQLHFSLYVNI